MLRQDNLIPLTSGAYQARGLIANAQRCCNLYQESNPQEADAPQPMTHYPRPGLKLLASPQGGVGRGVFTLSNGNLFAVVGPNVYYVDRFFNLTLIGQIGPQLNPTSLVDNGVDALLVDNTPNGYTIDLGTNAFALLNDPTGTFQGATRVDYADTFIAFNTPGTPNWGVTLSNQIAFNIFNTAGKGSYPDNIQTIAFNLRQMWLLGTVRASEIWYLSGGSSQFSFPYSEWPNIMVPYGCAAPYSLTRADINLLWVSRNEQGQAIIVQTQGYAALAISTRAIEYQLSTYPRVDDAIAYSYQQAGHTFAVWHFPSANKSWAYDLSTQQWSERSWIDNNGNLNRERVAFVATAYGKIIGQDWQNGRLYLMDLETFTDDLQPIVCIRAFPHEVGDLREITHTSFVADVAAGTVAPGGQVNQQFSPWNGGFNSGFGPFTVNESPMINMRYSNDGGNLWSNYRRKELFHAGIYRSMQRWRGLGMSRDRVYELSWSAPLLVTLQGAYVDPLQHGA
jgi:hypothetical protein